MKDGYREKVHLVDKKCPLWAIRKEEQFDVILKKQLQKLQTDHLDIYLLHGIGKKRLDQIKNLHLLKHMEEAKASGLINYIGFSFHDTYPVFKEVIDLYPWDACQIQYNYMDTNSQAYHTRIGICRKQRNCSDYYGTVKGGTFSNPPAEAKKIIASATTKRTPVDWALQFLWNRPEVSVVLSGMGAMQQVQRKYSEC